MKVNKLNNSLHPLFPLFIKALGGTLYAYGSTVLFLFLPWHNKIKAGARSLRLTMLRTDLISKDNHYKSISVNSFQRYMIYLLLRMNHYFKDYLVKCCGVKNIMCCSNCRCILANKLQWLLIIREGLFWNMWNWSKHTFI